MKLNKAEIGILVCTAAFVLFIGGYVLGRNSRNIIIDPMQPVSETEVQKPEDAEGKLDLNTATVEDLIKLPNIGEARARAIVEYRNEIGRFQSVLQLESVPGIGPKILESISPYLFVS